MMFGHLTRVRFCVQLAEMKVMRFPDDIKKKKVHGILKIIEPW
jgi:hypothetical protein